MKGKNDKFPSCFITIANNPITSHNYILHPITKSCSMFRYAEARSSRPTARIAAPRRKVVMTVAASVLFDFLGTTIGGGSSPGGFLLVMGLPPSSISREDFP